MRQSQLADNVAGIDSIPARTSVNLAVYQLSQQSSINKEQLMGSKDYQPNIFCKAVYPLSMLSSAHSTREYMANLSSRAAYPLSVLSPIHQG